jgi:hypothetical protein
MSHAFRDGLHSASWKFVIFIFGTIDVRMAAASTWLWLFNIVNLFVLFRVFSCQLPMRLGPTEKRLVCGAHHAYEQRVGHAQVCANYHTRSCIHTHCNYDCNETTSYCSFRHFSGINYLLMLTTVRMPAFRKTISFAILRCRNNLIRIFLVGGSACNLTHRN